MITATRITRISYIIVILDVEFGKNERGCFMPNAV